MSFVSIRLISSNSAKPKGISICLLTLKSSNERANNSNAIHFSVSLEERKSNSDCL